MLILEETQSEKINLLQQAIKNKLEISFWYKGELFRDPKYKNYTKQGWRFVQPTDIGTSKRSGKLILRSFQKGGISNTIKPEWKTFLVDEMSSINLMDGNESAYKPFQKPDDGRFTQNHDSFMQDDSNYLKIDTTTPPGENFNNINEPIMKNIEKPEQPLEPLAVKQTIKPKPETLKPQQPEIPKPQQPEIPKPETLKPQQPEIPKPETLKPQQPEIPKPEEDKGEEINNKPEFNKLKESSGFLNWLIKISL